MHVKKQQLKLDMEQQNVSKYVKAVYAAYLFNLYAEDIMQNGELDEAQAEIKIARKVSVTSDMQMTPPLWLKAKKN